MGLLACPPVLLRGGGEPRGRCCRRVSSCCYSNVVFCGGDLGVFSSVGLRAQLRVRPMSDSHTQRYNATGATAYPSGEDLQLQRRDAHCPQDPRSSAALKAKEVEGWPGAGRGQQAGSMDGHSPEECSKEKLEERMSLNSSSDSGVRSPLCRICFQGPDQGELISPCRCSGSVRCTHEPCLIKWISERGSWSCELCYYKYHVVNISTKNPLQWQTISLTKIEKVQIAAAVLGSLFLLASVSWLLWSSVSPHARWQRQDLFFQICYAMYGFMDWVCIVMIVHEGPSVFRIFHRWQAVNKRWKVLNYNKARDLEEQEEVGPDSSPREHPFLPEPNPRMGGLSGGRLVSVLSSPSTSSMLAGVAAATETTAIGQVTVWDREEEADPRTSSTLIAMSGSESSIAGQSLSSVFEQNHSYRWTYSLLHVLGQQHRPFLEQQNPEPQGLFPSPAQTQPPRDSNRELVMRVTTV